MAVKKTIAIAGATGGKGIAIAYQLAETDSRLLLISRDEMRLTEILMDIKIKFPNAEAEIIGCEKEACWEADIIILVVSYYSQKEIIEKIKEVATQKIVVSIPDDYTSFTLDSTAKLQTLLPYSRVVNFFNDTERIKNFIAGNDGEALQTFSDMVRSEGFDNILINNMSRNKTLDISNI
jgi:predicted dinucleotide-binding enzyme